MVRTSALRTSRSIDLMHILSAKAWKADIWQRPLSPHVCLALSSGFSRGHNGRRKPSLLAITDNGSGRAGSGPRAWARLYCSHIQSCGSWPARLNQSSIWAVESTWSSCLPFGKTVSSRTARSIRGIPCAGGARAAGSVLCPKPQVVQSLKSLSSEALLAVSQLCTTRSELRRPLVRRVAPEPRRLDHAAALRRR